MVTVIEGVVEHGRRLGRELGFPTANLPVPDTLEVADGVYRSRAEVDGQCYAAMSNLGRNPSVGGVARRLETHLFGFRGELYGRRMRVTLLERIREERTFETTESLRRQIECDRAQVLELERLEGDRMAPEKLDGDMERSENPVCGEAGPQRAVDDGTPDAAATGSFLSEQEKS